MSAAEKARAEAVDKASEPYIEPLTYDVKSFGMDCGDLCFGDDDESMSEFMRLCKTAMASETLIDMHTLDLRWAMEYGHDCAKIGHYIINQLKANGVDRKRLKP